MKKHIMYFLALIISFGIISSCGSGNESREEDGLKGSVAKVQPDWIKNANIYEVNIRQFSGEGNFAGFEEHIPRLKELGVDILWFMPVYPIGDEKRKGSLGSYYAVKDYKAINPEFGTMEEFKALVDKIHQHEMYVILDWVANHTAWDNQLIYDHPEWYTKDSLGQITSPVEDWTDVADLNYEKKGLRKYMISALKFWVEETGVDGYRCDVASMVPTEFWNEARQELNDIKPVFMLAESEEPAILLDAFDADYAWELHHIMNDISIGEKTVYDLDTYFSQPAKKYAQDDIRMNFTSNHDENSWNGTVWERMGDAAAAMAVLSATVPGMPLIYSGQEAGLDKRLSFFDKDEIDWKEHEMFGLYHTLLNLKHENEALWNGQFGGSMKRIPTSSDDRVFAFLREKDDYKVFVVLNLSPKEQRFTFMEKCYCDKYTDVFTGKTFEIVDEIGMKLGPWEYSICEKH